MGTPSSAVTMTSALKQSVASAPAALQKTVAEGIQALTKRLTPPAPSPAKKKHSRLQHTAPSTTTTAAAAMFVDDEAGVDDDDFAKMIVDENNDGDGGGDDDDDDDAGANSMDDFEVPNDVPISEGEQLSEDMLVEAANTEKPDDSAADAVQDTAKRMLAMLRNELGPDMCIDKKKKISWTTAKRIRKLWSEIQTRECISDDNDDDEIEEEEEEEEEDAETKKKEEKKTKKKKAALPPARICAKIDKKLFKQLAISAILKAAYDACYGGPAGATKPYEAYLEGPAGKGLNPINNAIFKSRSDVHIKHDIQLLVDAMPNVKTTSPPVDAAVSLPAKRPREELSTTQELVLRAAKARSIRSLTSSDSCMTGVIVQTACPKLQGRPQGMFVVILETLTADGCGLDVASVIVPRPIASLMEIVHYVINPDSYVVRMSAVQKWICDSRACIAANSKTVDNVKNELGNEIDQLWTEWDVLRRDLCSAL
jgi:hypothetical protein